MFFLKISRFFCFCEICKFQNLICHRRHNGSYIMEVTLMLIFFNPKYHQNEIYCMTNISNMFLAQCWRLKTSSRPFYDFIKMTIKQGLAIFIVDIYHFYLSLIHLFKKMKHWNLDIIGYCVIGASC